MYSLNMQHSAEIIKDFLNNHLTGLALALAGLGLLAMRRWLAGGVCRSKARLDGKTVLITGANSGIGKETALDLAKRGARVIMACKDLKKAHIAADEIRRESGNGNVVAKMLDLASLQSTRDLAKDIEENEERLDILINNAGIMMCLQSQTKDGFEMQFGVNHLGHFLLTNCLLDLLKKSAPSRIVVVSSIAHTRGKIHFDDINLLQNYKRTRSYCQSKLANLLFARELAARLHGTGVTVYALHPGVINTDLLYKHVYPVIQLWQKIFMTTVLAVLKSPRQGAQTSIYCAVDESLENISGLYYSDCAPKKPAPQGLDDAVGKRLWNLSASMVGLT